MQLKMKVILPMTIIILIALASQHFTLSIDVTISKIDTPLSINNNAKQRPLVAENTPIKTVYAPNINPPDKSDEKATEFAEINSFNNSEFGATEQALPSQEADELIIAKAIEIIKRRKDAEDKAYLYFRKIKDFETAYENDEDDPEWSTKIINNIYDSVLYNAENGEMRFPAIAIEQLDCKSTLCQIDFRNISDNIEDWKKQRTEFLHTLKQMGGGKKGSIFEYDRLLKSMPLIDGGTRYYISRGVSDLSG